MSPEPGRERNRRERGELIRDNGLNQHGQTTWIYSATITSDREVVFAADGRELLNHDC